MASERSGDGETRVAVDTASSLLIANVAAPLNSAEKPNATRKIIV
jgi:hypothetical protein